MEYTNTKQGEIYPIEKISSGICLGPDKAWQRFQKRVEAVIADNKGNAFWQLKPEITRINSSDVLNPEYVVKAGIVFAPYEEFLFPRLKKEDLIAPDMSCMYI